MGKAELKYISEQEYLDFERLATEKHEYFRGEIFAMSGASFAHNRISTNTMFSLSTNLKGKKCVPYSSDMRISVKKNTLYTYPDISVFCDELDSIDDKFDTATNPTVIIEILSKSTRNYDKGEKFTLYRDIETLQEYILIDSEKVMIEKFTKNDDKSWTLTEYFANNQSFFIKSIAVEMLLQDIYDGVKFAPLPSN